jgi:hypothetical protein
MNQKPHQLVVVEPDLVKVQAKAKAKVKKAKKVKKVVKMKNKNLINQKMVEIIKWQN